MGGVLPGSTSVSRHPAPFPRNRNTLPKSVGLRLLHPTHESRFTTPTSPALRRDHPLQEKSKYNKVAMPRMTDSCHPAPYRYSL